MKPYRLLAVAVIAWPLALWTATGETSDPVLLERELPLSIVGACLERAAPELASTCTANTTFASHWVGRAAEANLFLVRARPCGDEPCRAWLVSKGSDGVRTLVGVNGELSVTRGTGAYPAIQTSAAFGAGQRVVTRFDWNGYQYTRTDARVVYSVDGQECGNVMQCNESAQDALRARKLDRALRIWEQVHGVSWI